MNFAATKSKENQSVAKNKPSRVDFILFANIIVELLKYKRIVHKISSTSKLINMYVMVGFI